MMTGRARWFCGIEECFNLHWGLQKVMCASIIFRGLLHSSLGLLGPFIQPWGGDASSVCALTHTAYSALFGTACAPNAGFWSHG